MEPWLQLAEVVREQTGRRLVGTDGGLYLFSESEIRLPYGSVEGAVHELCHWVVASEEERKQPNMGLSTDWQHPKFDRMVRCEELAWSLEFYLYGDPAIEVMASHLTPEARRSGGGYNIGHSYSPTRYLKPTKESLEEAALAELERAFATLRFEKPRPDGSEALRREALQKAEAAGLPVVRLRAVIEADVEARKPRCIRCKMGVSNTPADYELRVQAANRKTRERGGSWGVEAKPLFCTSCQCSCGCEEYLSSTRLKAEASGREVEQTLTYLKRPTGPLNAWQRLIWDDIGDD
jgi:hypothetical protein